MCGNATMPMMFQGAQAAGVGMQAAGAYQAAAAQKMAYQYQAGIARQNAALADQSARTALETGAAQVQASEAKTTSLLGQQKAGFGAAGVATNEGSALDVLAGTKQAGIVDAMRIEDTASRDAWARRVQGANYRQEGALMDTTAAGIKPEMAGITSLIGGATQVAGSWYRYRRQLG